MEILPYFKSGSFPSAGEVHCRAVASGLLVIALHNFNCTLYIVLLITFVHVYNIQN